jgi:hypothetical protein
LYAAQLVDAYDDDHDLNAELAAATYEDYRQVLSPDGLADKEWMKKAMDFILKVTDTREQISPDQVFDFSLSRDAIAQMK